MSGISCLEQPAAARSDVRLTSGLGQRHQPYRKTRHAIDQGLVGAEWKTSAFNLEMTQPSALSPIEENYFIRKLGGPLALFDDNTLTLFDIGWKTSDVKMTQPSVLSPFEQNYFSGKLNEPTTLFAGSTLKLFGTSWKTSVVKMTQPSVLTPIEENYFIPKLGEPTALLAANTLKFLGTGWKTSIVTINRPSVLTLLEDTYVIENRREVAHFVEENQLGGLLKQARDPINKAFGEEAVKTLTVVEDDEGFRTLFCLVMIPGDMQEARNALKAFDEEWWLQHSPKVAGKLNFDFELI